MKKRIKNLTPTQSKIISALVTAIICITYITIAFSIDQYFSRAIIITVSLIFGVSFSLIFYRILLLLSGHGDTKQRELVKTFLVKNDFTEIVFQPSFKYNEKEMIMTILKAEGCKFYAKLTKNDNIALRVKDKNNSKIYNSIISNYFYFTAHFKQKEN